MRSMKGKKGKNRRLLLSATFIVNVLFWLCLRNAAFGEISYQKGEIKRLTFSKNDTVMYPSMDNEGKWVVFRQETIGSSGEKIASIRAVKVDDLSTKVLFVDNKVKAPPPFEDQFLFCGTKPPSISGNGRKVVFSMSLGKPLFLDDHYLGVVNIDGSD